MERFDIERAVLASELSPTERLVALTLLTHTRQCGSDVPREFAPSLNTLARETGCDRRTVMRCLNSLEFGGWIKRDSPEVVDARVNGTSNAYYMTVAGELPAQGVGAPHPYPEGGGTVPLPRGITPLRGRGTTPLGVGAPRPQGRGTVPPIKGTKNYQRSTTPPVVPPAEPEPAAEPPVVPRKRGTRIPEDFNTKKWITQDLAAWARTRAPHVDHRLETEKFVNYWEAKAGKDATKLDWVKTWQNWMLTAEERASHGNGNGHFTSNEAPITRPGYDDAAERKHRKKVEKEMTAQIMKEMSGESATA